jgi:hypothetical protein
LIDYYLFTTAPCVPVAEAFLRRIRIGANVFVVEHFGPNKLGLLDYMRERVHALTSPITGLTIDQVRLPPRKRNFDEERAMLPGF